MSEIDRTCLEPSAENENENENENKKTAIESTWQNGHCTAATNPPPSVSLSHREIIKSFQ